jgi:hypothetical protein
VALPYARTVIGVLNATLRLVETCGHIPESTPALQKLREAVHEVRAELEVIAKREPHLDRFTLLTKLSIESKVVP